MEKKTEQRTLDIFIANDGTEFFTENECLNYEKKCERLNHIKYFRINHSPDLTEGRGLSKSTFLAIEPIGNVSVSLILDLFTDLTYKKKTAWIMGLGLTRNYSVAEIDKNIYFKAYEENKLKNNVIFISSEPLDEFPINNHLPSREGESFK